MPRTTADMRARLIRDISLHPCRVSVDSSGVWRIDIPGWSEFMKRLHLVFCQLHSQLEEFGDADVPPSEMDTLHTRVELMAPYLKGIVRDPSKYPLFSDVQRCLAAKGQYANRLVQLSSRG